MYWGNANSSAGFRNQTRRGASAGFVGCGVIVALGVGVNTTFAAEPLRVSRSAQTGAATLVAAPAGQVLPMPVRPGAAVADPLEAVATYGALFGIDDTATQLQRSLQAVDRLGFTHTTFKQVYRGVPVFSGVLRVHQNGFGGVTAINGDFYPIPDKLQVVATRPEDDAIAAARARLQLPAAQESIELVIVDPAWYGDPARGARLAYYLVMTHPQPLTREAFFVDAHSGEVLDQWTLLESVRSREVYDDAGGTGPGTLVRGEGDPATGDPEADQAYDYSGDTYDFFFRAFGRDSTNDAGLTMISHVNSTAPPCPNAYGGGGGSTFCSGTTSDDVVGHEFMHSITGFTAGLIYQNQSGQLNEAMSDIYGELVDLYNGDASAPGVPGGSPSWPAHGSGPGTDTPNDLRTQCSVPPSAYLTVNTPPSIAGTYVAGAAGFGPALTLAGTTGSLSEAHPPRACDIDLPFVNAGLLAGKVVLIDRGDCPFVEKVLNVQDAGAIAAIVVNNVPGAAPFNMGGFDPAITIPSLMVSYETGELIRSAFGSAINVTLKDAPDGLLDGVRWLTAEDSWAFGGAIRDMWDPTCKGHPDRANSPLQTCSASDNGGVHSGSGVMNHAFAIMTDGKSFNGYTVTGIGTAKAAAVVYRALTEYMTPATDFRDAEVLFNQAAQDLIGTAITDPRSGLPTAGTFTASDALAVADALLAVEMDTDGACGANADVLSSVPPEICSPRSAIWSDDFESGNTGWSMENSGPPTPYDWGLAGGLPFARPGTAWFCDDPSIGDCAGQDESGVHYLTSPPIEIPPVVSGPVYVMFTHYLASEPGWDGGVLSFNISQLPNYQPVTAGMFTYNPYNTTLNDVGSGNTNPLAGMDAYSGAGGQWGTTIISFDGVLFGGETLTLRFEFGKDGCTGVDGWYIDDLEVYTCATCVQDVDCNDHSSCTCDRCGGGGACTNDPLGYGNVNCLGPAGQTNLDDILCVLGGFGNFTACPNSDIAPACTGNGLINLDDILAVLAAFAGADPCGCS